MRSRMAKGERLPVGSLETWAKTYGCVGADWSLRISHFGAPPRFVIATVQPGGALPSGAVSKLITVPVEAPKPKANNQVRVFIGCAPGRIVQEQYHPYLPSILSQCEPYGGVDPLAAHPAPFTPFRPMPDGHDHYIGRTPVGLYRPCYVPIALSTVYPSAFPTKITASGRSPTLTFRTTSCSPSLVSVGNVPPDGVSSESTTGWAVPELLLCS